LSSQPLSAVSCAPDICVAGERDGHLFTTLHPGGGAWSRTRPAVGGTAALSCVSHSLCVGVDRGGVVTRRGSSWRRTPIGGSIELDTVSCVPSGVLCVAGGINNSDNDVFQNAPEVAVRTTSRDRWDTQNLNGSGAMNGVSCPAASLCVGVGRGYVTVSRNPTAGRAATWVFSNLGGGTVRWADVACASPRTCVAVGRSSVAVSIDGGETWAITRVRADLTHVACVSERLCVAVAPHNVLVSTEPAAGTWSRSRRGGGTGIACSPSRCALVDVRGTVRFADVIAP
jgi:hypothetical protein